jgi:membrane-associated phospholipid phosphatase
MATTSDNMTAAFIHPSPTTAHLRRWLLPPALLLTAGLLAITVDHAVAQRIQSAHCPGALRDYLQFAEMFGHGLGVLLIGIVVGVLDPNHRRALPRLMTMAWGAGLAANVIKLMIARTRPRNFDFSTAAVWWESFLQWFPPLGADSGSQSFPSAHTATATGLALALAWLYPRGRWLFVWFAVSVALQRIQCGAHFLSDVLCGAALGWLFAAAFLHLPLLSRRFDRLEQ